MLDSILIIIQVDNINIIIYVVISKYIVINNALKTLRIKLNFQKI